MSEVAERTPLAAPEATGEPADVAPTAPEAAEKPAPAAEAEEPQNALTKKFTDAEWKALKQLRERLPSVFSEAYPDKAEATTAPITLWGVTISPTGPNDARASVILVKFLRARNLDVDEAYKMLVDTLRWRQEFKVEEAVKDEHAEQFGKLGRLFGHDKEGMPVAYNLYGANQDLKAIFGDLQKFLRWRVAFMEQSIELLDFENVDQMIQVHDYAGVSMSSRDANQKAAASQASAIFQNYYPEFLSRKFFVNVPSIFTWIFWLFKPLLSAKTLAKMSVVGTGPETIGAAMLPFVDAAQLPKRYGGTAEDLA
ncbi:CRAL-TRIO domain-containing protein [Amylocystis lapponica]|nr:CRAL-TRIO domain-containing protein [Amylocystis lapponica]